MIPGVKLRHYQEKAIKSVCHDAFANGIIALPTGTGKSIVIAEICNYYKEFNAIVLQPSKEILTQNFHKYKHYSHDASIYSASLKQKNVDRVCFGTPMSVYNSRNEFDNHKDCVLIIDECHLTADYGIYNELINRFKPKKLIGLTATPYRMKTKFGISYYMLTRTKNNIFNEFAYIYQAGDALKEGYWSPLRYFFESFDYNQDDLEVGSSDFKERSIATKNISMSLHEKVIEIVEKTDKKHILVFLTTIEECKILQESLSHYGISCAMVNSLTKSRDRDHLIARFKNGEIKVMINVGIFTTGFDFPELDCIVLLRPTLSISLYYQMIGRGVRIANNKAHCDVYDLCGNVKRFGKVEDFQLIGDDSKYLGLISGSKVLIRPPESYLRKRGVVFENTIEELERIVINFGKYRGATFKDIPKSYLTWCIEKQTPQWQEMDKYMKACNEQSFICIDNKTVAS